MTKEEIANKFKPLVWGQTMFTRKRRAEYCAEIAIEYSKQQNIELQKKLEELMNEYMAVQNESNMAAFKKDEKKVLF